MSIPQYDGWLKVKHLCGWVAAEPDVFIMEYYFYLKEELKSKKVIQSWVFGRHLIRNEWSEPLQRKCSTIFIAGGKSWSFQAKFRILELCLLHCIGSFPIFTNLSHEIGVYINDCDVFIYIVKMKCVNISQCQLFCNDEYMMLQSYAWIKDPSKVQDCLMDFNGTEYKLFMDSVSDATLQLISHKLPFVTLWYNTPKIKYYLQRVLNYFFQGHKSDEVWQWVFFTCFNQNNISQYIEIRSIWESRHLLIIQTWKRFSKM